MYPGMPFPAQSKLCLDLTLQCICIFPHSLRSPTSLRYLQQCNLDTQTPGPWHTIQETCF